MMDLRVLIQFYLRKRWYGHLQQLCGRSLESNLNPRHQEQLKSEYEPAQKVYSRQDDRADVDTAVRFWGALTPVLQRREESESTIRELESLRKRSASSEELPYLHALIGVHLQSQKIDKDEISELEQQIRTAEKTASKASLLLCASFFWHQGQYCKAEQTLDQLETVLMQTTAPQSSQWGTAIISQRLLVIRGWLSLAAESMTQREKAAQFFDQAPKRDDVELLLGTASYYAMMGDVSRALGCLDDLLVLCPWFEHSLGEKALLLAEIGNWEQCSEAVDWTFTRYPGDLEALRVHILLLLSRNGRPGEAALRIHDLLGALKDIEPNNAALFCDVGRQMVRISDGTPEVVTATIKFVQHALEINPTRAAFHDEMGYHRELLGDFRDAMQCRKQALKLDDSDGTARYGLIYAQIKLRELEDASQQLEFLSVVQDHDDNPSEFLTFLQALMAWELEHDRSKQIRLLQRAAQLHWDQLKQIDEHSTMVPSFKAFCRFDPMFLYEVASELLQSDRPLRMGNKGGSVDTKYQIAGGKEGIVILEKLVQKCPGLLRAQCTLAHAYFDTQQLEGAYRVCHQILNMEPNYAPALLLQARVSLDREYFQEATTSLEGALSLDFAIHQSPVYWLVKARISESNNNLREALEDLQIALQMLSSLKSSSSSSHHMCQTSNQRCTKTESLADQASVYIHMAQILSQLGNTAEATTTILKALQAFHGTSQEARVLLASNKVAVGHDDHDLALPLLSRVSVNSSIFAAANMAKAGTFLTHLKDAHSYVQCAKELVTLTPHDATAYVHLAEAYLRIQMRDQALEVLHTAATLDPDNPLHIARVVRVLIANHDYMGAIDFYEDAVHLTSDSLVMRKDLVQLYVKLHRFDDALRVAQEMPPICEPMDSEELDRLLQLQDFRLAVPDVHCGLNNTELALQTLLEAYDLQKFVLNRLRDKRPQIQNAQQGAIAETCFRIAKLHASSPAGRANVIRYCELALHSDETHESALLLLARVHQHIGELGESRGRCMALLRLNPTHEKATLLLSELLIQMEDHDAAIDNLQRLLMLHPDNFMVLSHLLNMLRNVGRLNSKEQGHDGAGTAQRYLHWAAVNRVACPPGLHFCRGLLARFCNRVNEAIDEFNQARHDSEWGQRALVNLIEVYLNPVGFRFGSACATETVMTPDPDALEVVDALLEELRVSVSGCGGHSEFKLKFRVLEAYSTIAERSKHMLQLGSHRFMDLLQRMGRDYVPALLGLAVVYLVTQQESKARNQLKRIAKLPYEPMLADDFERSYLLLADMYISRSKFDLAQDLCKRALKHNQSSFGAWELLGIIMEKEQAYVDAARCYEKAWVCHGEISAEIGFKLAFNYLKAKKLVAAVDVCHKVLDQYPDYPKIRTEILEKAYAGFRP